MLKVAVIIPVFNAEQHLRNCLSTLLNQTLNEIELIFVNDGSTDNSPQLVDQFATAHANVKVIHQKNAGVSAARNAGLELVSARYVGFMDADDALDAHYFERLYTAAESNNCDLVITGFITETDGKTQEEQLPFSTNVVFGKEQIHESVLPNLFRSNQLNSVCTKLFRNDTIGAIRFPVGVALGEDGVFTRKCIMQANRLIFLDYKGYIYKEVSGSATRNLKKHNYFEAAIADYANTDGADYVPNFDALRIEKLITQTVMCVSLYSKPNNGLTLSEKVQYISDIINHPVLSEAFSHASQEIFTKFRGYSALLVHLIKRKQAILLYLVLQYTHFRNRN